MIITLVEQFWQTFLSTLSGTDRQAVIARGYTAEAWGDNPALADELGGLIAAGVKTATCGALWGYEAEGDPLPTVGLLTVVLDGAGKPLCLIETTEVTIRAFNEVDAQFAYEEGEDDRSLASWREGHQRFFTRTLAPIGGTFAETMPLVCERFRLMYPKAVVSGQSDSG
jgi:uncharacterized protein YhfF